MGLLDSLPANKTAGNGFSNGGILQIAPKAGAASVSAFPGALLNIPSRKDPLPQPRMRTDLVQTDDNVQMPQGAKTGDSFEWNSKKYTVAPRALSSYLEPNKAKYEPLDLSTSGSTAPLFGPGMPTTAQMARDVAVGTGTLAKGAAQGLLRVPAEFAITAGQAGFSIMDMINGTDFTSRTDEKGVPTTGLEHFLGAKPLEGYGTKILNLKEKFQGSAFAQETGLDRYSLPLAFAGTVGLEALNFDGAGGRNAIVSNLVKAKTAEQAAEQLVKIGIDPDLIPAAAERLALTTDKAVVEDTLDVLDALQKTKQLTERAATQAGELEQLSSQIDDLKKQREQTPILEQRAAIDEQVSKLETSLSERSPVKQPPVSLGTPDQGLLDQVLDRVQSTPRELRAALAPHFQSAALAKMFVDKLGDDVVRAIGGKFAAADLKGSRRVIEKGLADYGGDFSRVKDYARGSIIVEYPEQAIKALEEVQRIGSPVGEPKVSIEKPLASGYRTIIQNVRAPNGQIAEIQVTTKELFEAKKKYGDAMYNQQRKIISDAMLAGRKLTKKEAAQVNYLQKKMQDLYAEAYASGKRLRASASETGSPESRADTQAARAGKDSQDLPSQTRQGSEEKSKSASSKTTKPSDDSNIDESVPQEGGGDKKPPAERKAAAGIDPKAPDDSIDTIAKKTVAQEFRSDKLNLTEELETGVLMRLEALGLDTRTVQTFDDMRKAAEELGTDPATLLRDAKSGRINAAEAVALKNTINSSAQMLDSLEKQLIEQPGDAGVIKQIAMHDRMIDEALKKLIRGGTEAGRAVASFRILANKTMEPAVWLQKAKRELGERELTDDMRRSIQDMISKNDRHGLATFISMLRDPSLAEQAITLWKAGLLTSPTTHIANIGGNTTMSALMTASDLTAVPLDVIASLITGKRTTTTGARVIGAKFKGSVAGVKDAYNFAKTGVYPDELLSKYDLPHRPVFKNPLLKGYTDAVFRSLGAEDIFFRQVAMSESLEKQAIVTAKNEGLSGTAAKQRIGALLQEPTNEMIASAIDAAEYATFSSENVVAKLVQTGKAAVKDKGVAGQVTYAATEFLAPFVRTPVNVAARIADFSPLGFIKALARFANPATRGQENLVKDLSRAITGTGMIGFGAYLYQKGLMTGNAPSDAKERAQFYSEGKQPNSIYLYGGWRRLDKFSPLGNLFSLGADFERLSAEETGLTLGTKTALSGVKTLTGMTFLKGVSGGLEAVNDPDRFGEAFLEQTVGSSIPSVVGRAAGTIDPVQRDPDGALDALKGRLPFLSEQLPAKRDVFGNAQERPGGRFNLIDPFQSTDAVESPLFDEARKIGVSIGYPSKTVAKTTMTNREYSAFQLIRGKTLEGALTNLVATPEYQEASTSDKGNMFDKTIEAVNTAANDQVFPLLMIARYDLPADTDPETLKSVLTELQTVPAFKKASTEMQGRALSAVLAGMAQ